MRYEYRITFFKVEYKWKNERNRHEFIPDVQSLIDNPDYKNYLTEMGNDGWELIQVQPLFRGVGVSGGNYSSGYSAYGFPIIEGYYLFWRWTDVDA